MKKKTILAGSVLFLISTIIIVPFVGSESLHLQAVLAHLHGTTTTDGLIFFRVRLPRVIMAAIAGASLSLVGVVFQALLRNPLATPYTLGISSGGTLGAVLAIKTGLVLRIGGFSTVQVAAFMGSLGTVALVFLLARRQQRISVYTMILAGVTVSYFFSALVLVVHFLADFTETHQMIRWMMGGLDVVEMKNVLRLLPFWFGSVLVLVGMSRMFNLISLSEEAAMSKGVRVGTVQGWSFLLASLITGMVVAFTGPIGFVGLIVPHLMRLLIGPDHRYLLPAALFAGGGFLVLCDTLARTMLAPIDIPVGIITAIIGGPFFLYLLLSRKHIVG